LTLFELLIGICSFSSNEESFFKPHFPYNNNDERNGTQSLNTGATSARSIQDLLYRALHLLLAKMSNKEGMSFLRIGRPSSPCVFFNPQTKKKDPSVETPTHTNGG
jgi:hypothetical protein